MIKKYLKEKINNSIDFFDNYVYKFDMSEEMKSLKELLDIKLFFQEILLNLENENIKINEDKYNAISRI